MIVCFDLETTGLDKSKDFIIQIAAIKIDPETQKVVDKLNEYVKPIGSYTISLAAYFKHGIKPEFLEDKPTLKELAPKIIEFFDGCDIMTYNGTRFDIPFLKVELNKVGYDIDFTKRNCIDVFLEEKRRNGNTLEATFERYFGKTMLEFGLEAHNAYSDIKATYGIYKKQLEEAPVVYENMIGEDGVIDIMDFRGQMVPCFTIGKYRQISVEFVAEIDQGYLIWCCSDKSKFMKSTKDFIANYIK